MACAHFSRRIEQANLACTYFGQVTLAYMVFKVKAQIGLTTIASVSGKVSIRTVYFGLANYNFKVEQISTR